MAGLFPLPLHPFLGPPPLCIFPLPLYTPFYWGLPLFLFATLSWKLVLGCFIYAKVVSLCMLYLCWSSKLKRVLFYKLVLEFFLRKEYFWFNTVERKVKLARIGRRETTTFQRNDFVRWRRNWGGRRRQGWRKRKASIQVGRITEILRKNLDI